MCTANKDHISPPHCIHYHGPHAADDPNCIPLSKGMETTVSKSQLRAVWEICAVAQLPARAQAGCVKRTENDNAAPSSSATSILTGVPVALNSGTTLVVDLEDCVCYLSTGYKCE